VKRQAVECGRKMADPRERGNIDHVKHLLVLLRLAKGISQKELAQRLGVNESDILYDEEHHYLGLTTEKAIQILKALEIGTRHSERLP
jgi:transcriptional regulator with XRE-family HTH domain